MVTINKSNTIIPPWQQETWQQLLQRYQQQQLPQALLVAAPPGLGKLSFAKRFSQRVLCTKPGQQSACGHCASCQLFIAATHPDYFLLQPEDDSRVIKVDAIRALIDKLRQSAHRGGYKVAIIESADNLNFATGNALLKTLEEPTAKTLIILLSNHAERVLPTLRSRCQLIRLSSTSAQDSCKWLERQNIEDPVKWLALAEGAPLLAQQLANDTEVKLQYQTFMQTLQEFQQIADPIKTAVKWQTIAVDNLTTWLSQFYMDLIRLASKTPKKFIVHQDYFTWLEKVSTQSPLARWFAAYDRVIALRELIMQATNVNILLQLEATLIDIITINKQQGEQDVS